MVLNPVDNNITDEQNITKLSFKIVAISAIGYVIAMMWADYIQLGISKIYPINDMQNMFGRFLLILIITIALFFIAYILVKLIKYAEKNISK